VRSGYIIAVDGNKNQIKQVTGGILLGDLQYTGSEEEATEFITDSNGSIAIYNIIEGDYEVIETSIGDNIYYEIDEEYISWESNAGGGEGSRSTVTVKRQKSTETKNTSSDKYDSLTVMNRKKYVDLSGYVWIDAPPKGKDPSGCNELWQDDESDVNDVRVQGIPVLLKDVDGNIVELKTVDEESYEASATTSSDGTYIFKRVEIDKLEDYHIEFSYNGMGYQCVTPKLGKPNGSKAAEGSRRAEFNSNYATITYGKSNAYSLEYATANNESKLIYGSSSQINNSYTGNYGIPVSGVAEKFTIISTTTDAYGTTIGAPGGVMTPEEIRMNDVENVENINLGLVGREQIDLSLVKDLNSIHVGINGATHVYKYGDRYKPGLWQQDPYNMSPQVKFEQKYGTMSYTRALYSSDVYADNSVTDDTLRVKVTYKIGVKNSSANLVTTVNEIEDYYDSKYLGPNSIKVGKQVNDDGEIVGEELPITFVNSGDSSYYKMKIESSLELSNQRESFVYVQLEIDPTHIKDVLGTENKFYNLAEISSYSTTLGGSPYAAIDIDSQPGNAVVGDKSTYEDDTDMAPGLQLVLQDERKLDGKVFVDSTTGELCTGEIRQGDGEYQEGEEGVKDVEVKLMNLSTGEVASIYNESTGNWEKAIMKTDDNGEYKIGGFLPENYEIVFIWGDKTYRVQDYKGTIYKESEARENNIEWYKDRTKRYSDAKDNYETRLAIDHQSNLVINSNKTTILEYEESGQLELVEGGNENLITKMDSYTPNFRVNLEYDDTKPSDVSDEYELNSNGTVKMNGIYAVKKEEHRNYLKNIDFGIVERARQVLRLDKDVTRVKITLANGMVLMDAKIVEDANGQKTFENDVQSAVYIPKSSQANGQVKFELDNEIIQGARVEIEYALTLTNISEVDYTNQNYYWYGNGHGEKEEEIVTLKTENVIDYLDNKVSMDTQQNPIGSIIQNTDKNNLITRGLLEDSSNIRNLLNRTQKVFMIDNAFGKTLKPTEVESTTFFVSKLLSNVSKDEDWLFDNSAEIVKTVKSGGAPLITIPGNYVSKLSQPEFDNDDSETVVIVPPTGLTTNYIVYTILAISSLGILICGIVLIKKFILK